MLCPKHLVNNGASVVLERSPKFGARGLNSLHMAQDVTTPDEIHSRVFDRKRLSAANLETHAPDQIRVTRYQRIVRNRDVSLNGVNARCAKVEPFCKAQCVLLLPATHVQVACRMCER